MLITDDERTFLRGGRSQSVGGSPKNTFVIALVTCLGACGTTDPADGPTSIFTSGTSYWSVTWPQGWETLPAKDPTDPSLIKSAGPLSKDILGSAWGIEKYHGVVVWPDMVIQWIGKKPDIWEETVIDQKRALIYEYNDQQTRYMGCAVDRGDALIFVAIGCPKASFEEFRERFKKVISSVRCGR